VRGPRNLEETKDFDDEAGAVCTSVCTNPGETASEDPLLAELLTVWKRLPMTTRRALVEVAKDMASGD